MIFPVKFNESKVSFKIGFEDTDNFEFSFGEISYIPTSEVFSGSYSVTPKVTEQNIPTAEKYMKYDMTIKSIPYFNVSNTAGGSTVYIGSEI